MLGNRAELSEEVERIAVRPDGDDVIPVVLVDLTVLDRDFPSGGGNTEVGAGVDADEAPTSADESLRAEEQVLVEVQRLECSVQFDDVSAHVVEGARLVHSRHPTQARGTESTEVALDVTLVERRHGRAHCLHRIAVAHVRECLLIIESMY